MPARHIERTPVPGGQLKGFPLAKGRGIGAHIHQHVPDRARGAADEFDLRLGLGLEMHAADHAALPGEGEIALRPAGVQPVGGKLLFAVRSAPGIRARLPAAPGRSARPRAALSGVNFIQTTFTCGMGMMNLPPCSR